MQCGTRYSGIGFSSCGSAVQGARAGLSAAAYALRAGKPAVADEHIVRLNNSVFAPRERKKGFTPAWVTQLLQSAMMPYYVLLVKEKRRLEAARTNIEFMRDHLVPLLTAKDSHELRLAHETSNMVLNAEMKLRASLARAESRGTHFREDYPARDDAEWLAWIKLKDDGGKMKLVKEPIPKEWRPDPSVPYEERYTFRFPGELEYLKRKGTNTGA